MYLSWGALIWSIPSYLTLLGNTWILTSSICNLLIASDVSKLKVIEWQNSKYLKSLLSTAKNTRHVARTETLVAFIESIPYHFFFYKAPWNQLLVFSSWSLWLYLADWVYCQGSLLLYALFDRLEKLFLITVKVRNELQFHLQTYTFPFLQQLNSSPGGLFLCFSIF